VVVFDSGFLEWAPAWSTVPQIAKWSRACIYDRAGAGFSDPESARPQRADHPERQDIATLGFCRHGVASVSIEMRNTPADFVTHSFERVSTLFDCRQDHLT
jgi:hypothetical protein